MTPRGIAQATPHVDVTAAMDERPRSRAVSLKVIAAPPAAPQDMPAGTPDPSGEDPYANVEI